MANKEGAHEALSLLFQWYVVPPKTIVDVSREKTLGIFKLKVVEDGCHLRQTETESPWQIAAEGGICKREVQTER